MNMFARVVIVTLSTVFPIAYTQSFLFSYLPAMTVWFGYKEQDKGYFTGIVVAAFYFGSLVTTYPFSILADKVGHKRMMIILLTGNTICNLLFGFSLNIYFVVILRFLSGWNVVVISLSRALITIYCEPKNHAKGMSINQTGWATGLVGGSAAGGYMVSLAVKYPGTWADNAFLETFPYIFPPLLAALFSVIGIIVTIFLYPEGDTVCLTEDRIPILSDQLETSFRRYSVTRSNYSTFGETTIAEIEPILQDDCECCNDVLSDTSWHGETKHDVESHAETNDVKQRSTAVPSYMAGDDTTDISTSDLKLVRKLSNAEPQLDNFTKRCFTRIKQSTFVAMITDLNTFKALIAYGLLSSTVGTYIELFSVWASTVKELGGLGYSTDDIGFVMAVISIPGSIAQLIAYPVGERRIGSIKCQIIFMVIGFTSISITPLVRFLDGNDTRMACLITLLFLFRFADGAGCTACVVILNNCVPRSQAAAINGLAAVAVTIGFIVMPLVGGAIFAGSIMSTFGPPIDSSLVFVYMGFHCFLTAAITYSLPKQVDAVLEEY